MKWIKSEDNVTYLNVYIVPNAKKNEIIGEYKGRLKVKISSPPVDGSANKEIISFFAKILKVNKSKIKIVSGEKSREKKIAINELIPYTAFSLKF